MISNASKRAILRSIHSELGRAIHRAEDLVGDWCATVKVIGLSMQCSQALRGQRWLTFLVRRENAVYEETIHKRQSERNQFPKIQFS